jgi:CRP/FNR family transcriptional regulator, cyclic AMP receptor protein
MGSNAAVVSGRNSPINPYNSVMENDTKRSTFSKLTGSVMSNNKNQSVAETPKKQVVNADWETLLAGVSRGKTVLEYGASRIIYRQGEPADSVYFIQRGKVKHAVTSQQGKEAIVALLTDGDIIGEGCLAGRPLRIGTATAITDCTLVKIDRAVMSRMLHEQHDISELFVSHLLSRNLRYEEDLIDQLFNSSEKRLARALLLLSNFGKESRSESVLPRVNQEHLAQMVGTTRSRVSHFMNKFKKLGFVDYDGPSGGLKVHSGLLSVVLHD